MPEEEVDNATKSVKEDKNKSLKTLNFDVNEIRIRSQVELNPENIGHIDILNENYCVIILYTSKMMIADKEKMVHSGFLGSTAEYSALVAVNEPNGMIFSIKSQYFACAKFGDEIKFTATLHRREGRKREVFVVGKIESIKIYDAKITIVIPDYHPLKIQLLDFTGVKN